MTITWLCLFWLFFFYSFIGWCIEVCAAAVQHRKFVNRGFVAGPLCPIYGFGAMLFEIFLPELKHCGDNGAMIAAQGYHEYQDGNLADWTLNGLPTLPIDYR